MPQLPNHQDPRSPDSMLHGYIHVSACMFVLLVALCMNSHACTCCACLRGLSHVPTCTYSSSIFRTLYSPCVSMNHRLICPEFPCAFLDRGGGGGGGETQYMLLHGRGGLLVSSRMVTTINTGMYMYAYKPEVFVLVSSHEADAALSTSRYGIYSTQRRGKRAKRCHLSCV